jgi:hypothetical protein
MFNFGIIGAIPSTALERSKWLASVISYPSADRLLSGNLKTKAIPVARRHGIRPGGSGAA